MVFTHRRDRAPKGIEKGEKTKRRNKRRYGGNVVNSTRFKNWKLYECKFVTRTRAEQVIQIIWTMKRISLITRRSLIKISMIIELSMIGNHVDYNKDHYIIVANLFETISSQHCGIRVWVRESGERQRERQKEGQRERARERKREREREREKEREK